MTVLGPLPAGLLSLSAWVRGWLPPGVPAGSELWCPPDPRPAAGAPRRAGGRLGSRPCRHPERAPLSGEAGGGSGGRGHAGPSESREGSPGGPSVQARAGRGRLPRPLLKGWGWRGRGDKYPFLAGGRGGAGRGREGADRGHDRGVLGARRSSWPRRRGPGASWAWTTSSCRTTANQP